jgi:LysM repeat protein
MLPKLRGEHNTDAPRVSDEFDWGKDDLRTGRSRLEQTASMQGDEASRRVRRRRPLRSGAASRPAVSAEQPPEPSATERAVEPTVSVPEARVRYRIVAGDSMQQIATRFGLTLDQVLAQAHVTSSEQIRVGTLLELHVSAPAAAPVELPVDRR